MKNLKKHRTNKVDFPDLDRGLLKVIEKSILEFMSKKGEDFRKHDSWADRVVHLSAAGVQYIAVKDGKFSYFKNVPEGSFDLTINVGIEATQLPEEELVNAMPNYETIRAVTGLHGQEPNGGHSRFSGGLKAERLYR